MKLFSPELHSEKATDSMTAYLGHLLTDAIKARASDLHLEAFEHECNVRYRIDGVLYEKQSLPHAVALPLISRLKVMAHLDIAERRLPQDGRIQETIEGIFVDLRISTLPTQFGESVVLRVLNQNVASLDFSKLLIPSLLHEKIFNILQKPHGLFIVTGPTGSGKTTTLYSCLQHIHSAQLKILTAEDPIEYEINGLQQTAIHDAIGLSFSTILRSFLRQDPDVIMIGETRDIETARIALQAALTGHRVFTTLHTRDAPGAITRLIDMKIEPLVLSAALEGVLAQRLVRTICTSCRHPYEPSPTEQAALNLTQEQQDTYTFYHGSGCADCHQTGYRGRRGIFELLTINDSLRLMIHQRAPHQLLRQKALEQGMISLREDALHLLFEGVTTIEEVLAWS